MNCRKSVVCLERKEKSMSTLEFVIEISALILAFVIFIFAPSEVLKEHAELIGALIVILVVGIIVAVAHFIKRNR